MMSLCNYDGAVLNYIYSMQGEYADEILMNDPRPQVFWALSSVRRETFSSYTFLPDNSVFIVGDRFGALTGILCEKAKRVYTLLHAQKYAEAVRKRFIKRNNLDIITENQVEEIKCLYVVINLEYTVGFNLADAYEFNCMADFALAHMEEESRLLIIDRQGREELIRKLLYRRGLYTYSISDPSNNGSLLLEAGKTLKVEYEKKWEPVLGGDSQLLCSKWVQKNRYIFLDKNMYSDTVIPKGLGIYSQKEEWQYFLRNRLVDQDIIRINQVKMVQIDLLQKLVTVCHKYDLKIYPVYGTLLGIIREGGMIFGDDDIDVALPREDYDKLMRLTDEFNGKYFLQTPFTDDCFYGGYTKLRNKETTAIHPQNEWTNACEGIAIDIFPIDAAYMAPKKEKRKIRKIRFLQRLLYAKSYGYFRKFKDMELLHWKTYKYMGKLFERNKLIEKLYKVMRMGDEKEKNHAIYCHYSNRNVNSARYINMSDFQITMSLLYEDIALDVPLGWDRILRGFYGNGYMNRHGFREEKQRHGFYDVNTPYTVYKKRFGGLQYPTEINEPIVLFGDGSLFYACLKYYKKKVNIIHLVQLPNEGPVNTVMGIPVERWGDFHALNLSKASYRAIICSGDARMAEQILQKAGYDDYYIFWQKRDWMLYANQSRIWKEIKESY
jgi:LPS biosynthesis protein